MMEKVCKNCGKSKNICEYHKNKNGLYGVHSVCKICKNEYKRIYRLNNKEKISDYQKLYELKNKESIKARKEKHRKLNLDIYNERQKKYNKKYPHKKSWRDILSSTLKRMGKPKEGHTIDLLGYSAADLKQHIESLFTEGMSWDNHGEWHIDHIKPVSSFDPDTPPSIVNSLDNLRPLWATTREINGVIYEGNLNRPKY